MRRQYIFLLTVGAAITTAAYAQNDRRQASITGGGSANQGKCTIEVRVDGAAEVEVRGPSATLRTLSGQPAQWRRFECTSAMPTNPAGFRFAGVDGRGRQTLIRDPQNGGVAVVRIEDKDNGSEGYTFDLFWGDYQRGGNNQGGNYQPVRPMIENRGGDRYDDRYREYGEDRYRPGWRQGEYYKRYGHGFPVDEAVRVCQQSIAQQARDRFRNVDIHFGQTRIDDNPGRNDWVIGSIDVHRGGREERFGFACSVNFDNGNVRSAELDERPVRR